MTGLVAARTLSVDLAGRGCWLGSAWVAVEEFEVGVDVPLNVVGLKCPFLRVLTRVPQFL